jgi:glycolate oxidase FAD binding subunit
MIFRPRDEDEIAEIVHGARARNGRIIAEGGGSRAGLRGARRDGAQIVSTADIAGVVHYDPAEMTITARAGTRVAEIEAAVAAHGQMLPFEPPDPRALYATNGAPTLGGMVAAGFSGPRRVQAGSLRDALLGARFVNGRGETIKAGGRVVKNVTGLDLARLQVGALGRFGILTELCFKLLPRPAARLTLALDGLDDARAVEALSAALTTPVEASGAAHDGARKLTLIRLENDAESIAARAVSLEKTLAPFGAARRLDADEADALWRDVRDLTRLAESGASCVWRVATAPSRAARIAAEAARVLPMQALYDWGGGLLHLASTCEGDACRAAIGRAVGEGGHARLLRGPAPAAPGPAPGPAAALKQRIAHAFDPDGVFAPAREA